MKSNFNQFIILILFFLGSGNVLALPIAIGIEITFSTSDYNGYNVSCFGSKNGWIVAGVTGGTPPYKYLWSTSSSDTTDSISGLSADYYSIIVIDADSIVAEAGINLTTPWALKTELISPEYTNNFNVSCYGCFNGSIITTVGGGVFPYSYLWNDSATAANRSGLGGGYFVLMVFDANGCKLTDKIFLSEPNGGWTIDGNTGTDPATQFIGTTDAKDFVVKTNGSERMRIGKDGKITMPTDNSANFERLIAQRIVSTDSLIFFGDSTLVFQTNANRIYGDPNGATYKGTGIGQGTVAFGQHSLAMGHLCRADVGVSESVLLGRFLTATTGANGSIIIGSGASNSNRLVFADSNSLAVGFNSNIPTMVVTPSNGINTTGNVGIGTSNPDANYKLEVIGKIHACEVKVDVLAGCDYVFEEGYKLQKVSEYGNFLRKNKHLPGIAPAKEMVNSGLDVGVFQMQLLKTVEEQALYIVQINERLEKIEKENEELKEKVKSFGNR